MQYRCDHFRLLLKCSIFKGVTACRYILALCRNSRVLISSGMPTTPMAIFSSAFTARCVPLAVSSTNSSRFTPGGAFSKFLRCGMLLKPAFNEPLNLIEFDHIGRIHQGDRYPVHFRACSSTDPVDVIGCIRRHVVIYHQINILNVNTPAQNIRGY